MIDECTSMENIRPATHEDIQAVFELNLTSFAEAWSYQAFEDAIVHHYDIDVWYTTHGKLLAYYLGQDVLDEVHIMQLAVDPTFRRQGFGLRLTQHILDKKRHGNTRHVWLEVRASNTAAQCLYTVLGFHITDRRKNYYTPRSTGFPRENALVMYYDLHA